MTEEKKVVEKPKKPIWSAEDKKLAVNYGCQLLVDDANSEQLLETKFPTDTMVVTYHVEGKPYKDLVRGSQVNIFDLYYDKLVRILFRRCLMVMELLVLHSGDINHLKK